MAHPYTLTAIIIVLLATTSALSFKAKDTSYYHIFKGAGTISSSDSSTDTKEFYGALKRVIKSDQTKGNDLYFFVWEKTLRTWSSGYFIGTTGLSQEQSKSSNPFN
jgi:hypothetical protein